ncbi:MAG: bifunctional 2-C-methyl-D-erythritol 4-phosphate cytidylyltransferase/2-C-methyl-D-erythritol 2,4-cyclodiphosphate synthase [Parvibaculaceae bacterium]|nr:bifunctional 2-C-methyl-D-erythritol 4-phosphate cytidylyltransferase/2-C-methyl-D-erythritol 2,4-cyclodiphosphate synthase [Parvibaculaceae bacterium]
MSNAAPPSDTIVAALIVAGGRGTRMGEGKPKLYRPAGGETVLRRTLRTFAAHDGIDLIQAVIHPDHIADYEEAARGLPKLLPPCSGGGERQDSVRLGLRALAVHTPGRVLIHDGARPFASPDLITAAIEALDSHQAALPALPVVDTLRRGHDGRAGETLSREALYRVQTPQAFSFQAILKAHETMAGTSHTDDAAIAQACGIEVALIEGEEDNFKITTAPDIERAERLIKAREQRGMGQVRVGMGYDVHRFGPGESLMLCGVEIVHSHGLIGHSDADVGLHALTDAILGALGDGDIGSHFPPSDPKWRGVGSHLFLAHAARLAAEKGASLNHADITIICERPKVGPHREAMRARIADILAIPLDRVSVKATTTEGLGFTGRAEGIAAQAVATLEFPAS